MVKNCVRVRDNSQPDVSDWFSVQSTVNAARLDRWREHRIDGRFRGKLHAAAGANPAKRAKRATVTAEWLFWSSTVRLRIRDLMLNPCAATEYPTSSTLVTRAVAGTVTRSSHNNRLRRR